MADVGLTFTVEALAVFTSVQHLIDAARTEGELRRLGEDNGIEPGSPQAGVMYTGSKARWPGWSAPGTRASWGSSEDSQALSVICVSPGTASTPCSSTSASAASAAGLIYHPATKDGKRLPYGDFSTHT